MSERPRRSYPRAAEVFGLTEREQLYYRLSEKRFQEILSDPATTIHQVNLSLNTFGEYVFVTVSREVEGQRAILTMYSLGYHEQREQWITGHWYWHSSHPMTTLVQQQIPLAEAQRLIQERRDEIQASITDDAPSQRAILFAFLAEITDEDGAVSELEDLEYLGLLPYDDEDLE